MEGNKHPACLPLRAKATIQQRQQAFQARKIQSYFGTIARASMLCEPSNLQQPAAAKPVSPTHFHRSSLPQRQPHPSTQIVSLAVTMLHLVD